MENIQERIDEIYNKNSKIPFMQSKDILKLGYTIGLDDATLNKTDNVCHNESDNNINDKSNNNIKNNDNDIACTSKELIAHMTEKIETDKIIKQQVKQQVDNIKKELVKQHENKSNIKILETQVNITGRILNYINIHHDIVEIYDYIKNLNKEFQEKYYWVNRVNNT